MNNEDNVDANQETQYTGIDQLLIHAIDQQPKDFQAVFNDLVTQRIMDRVEMAKKEVAQNYFNYEEQPEEPIDSDESEEQTDEVEQNGQDAETV